MQLGDGPSRQSPWPTLRRLAVVLGVLAAGLGVATGAWWVGLLGVAWIVAALVVPSGATMRALRETEERRALPEEP